VVTLLAGLNTKHVSQKPVFQLSSGS
jgi:hypothetical protein